MSLIATERTTSNRILTPANLGATNSERRAVWAGVSKQIKDGNHSAEEILEASGLNWTVSTQKIRAIKKGNQWGKIIEGYKLIIRDDTEEPLSIMSDSYVPVNNRDALNFADEVFGGGGKQGYYESAGSLKGGRKVFINCLLPRTMFVNGDSMDKIEQRVLIATSHDGSVPVVLKIVSLRVICQNTFNAALREKSSEIRIRHTQKLEFRVKEAQKALGFIEGYFDDLQGVMDQLATSKFTVDQTVNLARTMFDVKADSTGQLIIPTRTQNNIDKIVFLFENGKGNTGKTRWDALNAITEYIDHEKTGKGTTDEDKAENRAESVLFGAGVKEKERAMSLLLN